MIIGASSLHDSAHFMTHCIGGFVEPATGARRRGLHGIVVDPEGPQVSVEAGTAVSERGRAEHAPDHHLCTPHASKQQ